MRASFHRYARRCWRPRSPCRCSCGGYASRCWCPRSPCNRSCGGCYSGARSPCRRSHLCGYARRCWRPRSLCTCSSGDMLADAGAPAVLAGAPDAVMLADAGLSLHLILRRLCSQMLAPPRSLHWLLMQNARTSCAPSAVRSPAASAPPLPPPPPASPCSSISSACCPPCCRQPAPRGIRGTCPAAFSPE